MTSLRYPRLNMGAADSTILDISGNQILAGLTDHDKNKLRLHLEQVSLSQGEVLSRSGEVIDYAYFPQDTVLSLLSFMEEGVTVEVGLIGCEGLVGFHAAMGASTWSNGAVVAVPGKCLRMKTEVLEAEFNDNKVLRDRLLRFVRYFLAQVTQTVACNRVHHLEMRMRRWLLMVHDRAKRDSFAITHECIANMLGTDRSEITVPSVSSVMRD